MPVRARWDTVLDAMDVPSVRRCAFNTTRVSSINPTSLINHQPCLAKSYGQVTPRLRRIERLGRPLMHDLAAIHDVNVICELPAEIEILFDQKDRHAGCVA